MSYKHIVLVRMLTYLQEKQAFQIIDAHPCRRRGVAISQALRRAARRANG
jgi:23S rRNA A2030 N6-methylase RlmJ